MKITETTKKNLTAEFEDHISKNQWCEVTEWTNGEGFDVFFEDKHIALTESECNALIALLSAIKG